MSEGNTIRIVPQQDHDGILTYKEAIDAVYEGYHDRAEYKSLLIDDLKYRTIDPETGTRITNHFGISPSAQSAGALLHSQYPESSSEKQEYEREGNPVRVIYDSKTSRIRAIMIGEMSGEEFPAKGIVSFPTTLDTVVGNDVLARDDASVIGILGSGKQAQNQLVGHDQIRDFDLAKVYSPTKSHREAFKEELDYVVETDIEVVDSTEALIQDSDIIVCATNASSAVFDGGLLEPGQHVSSIVSSNKELAHAGQAPEPRRELDNKTVERADIYAANSLRQAKLDEQGDFVIPYLDGVLTWEEVVKLKDVFSGKHPGRTDDDQITVYNQNTPNGVTQMALAGRALEKIEKQDLGIKIETHDPRETEVFPKSEK